MEQQITKRFEHLEEKFKQIDQSIENAIAKAINPLIQMINEMASDKKIKKI